MRRILYLFCCIAFFVVLRQHLRNPASADESRPAPAPADVASLAVERDPAQSRHACDGRVYCSQMHSCEEATWFLQNCPGMKMDGDRDGVPCERQWCE